jgi:hypothetical protein
MESKQCLVCNKVFTKYASRGKERWARQRYCSPKCCGIANRGRHPSEATRLKLKQYHSQHPIAHWKGKHLSESHRESLRVAQYRRKERFGYINSPEARQKLSAIMSGPDSPIRGKHPSQATREKMGTAHRGAKCHLWKGGISFEPYSLEWNAALKRQIRRRDNFTCQMCWEHEKERAFDVHHIDYNKKNCTPSNLVTLCHRCHTRTNSNRQYWQNFCRTQFLTYA